MGEGGDMVIKKPSLEAIACLHRLFSPSIQERAREASRARNNINPLFVPPEAKRQKRGQGDHTATNHAVTKKADAGNSTKAPLAVQPHEIMSRARGKRMVKKGTKDKTAIPPPPGEGVRVAEKRVRKSKPKADLTLKLPEKAPEGDQEVRVEALGEEEGARDSEEGIVGGSIKKGGRQSEEDDDNDDKDSSSIDECLEPIINIGGSIPLDSQQERRSNDDFMSLEATRHGMLPPIHLLVPLGPQATSHGDMRVANSPPKFGLMQLQASNQGPHQDTSANVNGKGSGRRKRRDRSSLLARQKHEDRDAGHESRHEQVVSSWMNALTSDE